VPRKNIVDGILESELPKLGIFLSHKYTLSAIERLNLKGADQVLYEKITARAELECYIYPIIFCKHNQEDDHHGKMEYAAGYVYACTRADFSYLNGKGKKPEHNPELRGIPFIALSFGNPLMHWLDEGAEYTGNESRIFQEDTVYFNGAIVVLNKQAKKDMVQEQEQEQEQEQFQGN